MAQKGIKLRAGDCFINPKTKQSGEFIPKYSGSKNISLKLFNSHKKIKIANTDKDWLLMR